MQILVKLHFLINLRSPDFITIINSLSLYFTGLEYQLQSARRELCWWHHSPSNKQKPHNNKTTNNILAATTTTPKGDCETSLSESDLWQQIDLQFFTSYIATAIINEHDKLVQVFPNLINVCRKFRPNRTLINRWLISVLLWTIVHDSLHRSLNLRFFFIAYIFIFLFCLHVRFVNCIYFSHVYLQRLIYDLQYILL